MTTSFTVYVFFATWCVPCKQELPHIGRLARELAPRGVRFVLVSEDAPSTAPNVPAFVARYGIDADLVMDRESALLEQYNPTASIPFVVVVDRAGQVLFRHAGFEPGDEEQLEAALLQALAAPAAAAADRGLEVTSQTQAVWREDDFRGLYGAHVRGIIQRLDVAARARGLRAAVRLDGTLLDRDDAGGGPDDLRLEKASLAGRRGPVRVLLGDGYAAFGHGLALSVRKVDPLGVDTSLRGARVDLAVGRFGATALAGVFNPQNTDPIELATIDEPRDLVVGAELREQVHPAIALGQEVLVARLTGAAPDGGDADFLLAGATMDIAAGHTRAALELVGLADRGLAAGDGRELGHGAYASIGVDVRDVTLLIEGKAYRHFALGRSSPQLTYHEPPTLEREDQEVAGNADALGGRARVEWRATADTTAFASAVAYRYATDRSAPQDGGLAAHGYAGAEHRFASGAATTFSLGARRETLPNGRERLRFVQWNADAAVPLAHGVGLTAKWDHRAETKLASLGAYDFVKGLVVAGASWRGVTLSALYGYSTEATARPTHYPGAEVRVELRRRGDVRLFAGRLAGGRVCVSGACRDVPPFEGVRLELALRF